MGGIFNDLSVPLPNPPLTTAAIAWASLPAIGDASCSAPAFNHTDTTTPLKNGDGTTAAFTPVPVNTTTNSGQGYIVSSYDVGGNVVARMPQSKLAVWHLDATGPLIQNPDVTVAPFAAPPSARQAGSTNLIDTLDGRLTQAVGDPVSGIWTQHTVAGGAGSKATWYELKQSGPGLVLTQSGDVSSTTDCIFNAAVSPSSSAGGAVIEYSRSSAAIDPVLAAQFRVTSTPLGQMAPGEIVLASSAAADSENLSCAKPNPSVPCRWGDYSAATPDPVQPDVVWGTNEFITSNSTTPSWSDENFALSAISPPGAPTITNVTAGGQFACVSWPPSTVPSGAPHLDQPIPAYQGRPV